MVEDSLVDRKIAKGERFLNALDAAGVPVDAALWFYFEEAEAWRLIVSTPLVDEQGIGRASQAFREAAEAVDPPIEFDLGELRAVSRKDPIIKALRGLGDRASFYVGRTFGGFYERGVSFLGGYLYRAPQRHRRATR